MGPAHESWAAPAAPRRRFVAPRPFFSLIRRSVAPFVGFVGRRARGAGANAPSRTCASRNSASRRFCSCARDSEAVMTRHPPVSRGPSRCIARSRRRSGMLGDLARSKMSSTRESVVFTPWPPGPDERENRHESSERGIVTDPRTTISSAMAPICPKKSQRTRRPPFGRVDVAAERGFGVQRDINPPKPGVGRARGCRRPCLCRLRSAALRRSG